MGLISYWCRQVGGHLCTFCSPIENVFYHPRAGVGIEPYLPVLFDADLNVEQIVLIAK